jgi:aspartate kinase
MRFLMKFGGTSVGDAESVGRVVDIIEEHHRAGDELAVVVSAQRGVTDQLIAIANEIANSRSAATIEPFIQSLRLRHRKVLAEVAEDHEEAAGKLIEERLCDLENILHAVHNLRELTPRSLDYIITFGERLNSPVVCAAFMQRGIPSMVLDGCEAGILTTPQHGEAMALPESEGRIRSRVQPLLTEMVPVIMGFMGCTERGIVTTLGRSGSDYSAAIIGAGIDSHEIWIWTDVDGIMTSDPRLINDARVLSTVSYLEVMELSYFGAKVMHPRSIEPAMKKNIVVRVKNTFNPSHPGTSIVRHVKWDSRVVKALTYINKVALINICGAQMIGRPGVAKAIFSALADREVNVMMISQGSSEANISFVVREEDGPKAVRILHDEFNLSREDDA